MIREQVSTGWACGACFDTSRNKYEGLGHSAAPVPVRTTLMLLTGHSLPRSTSRSTATVGGPLHRPLSGPAAPVLQPRQQSDVGRLGCEDPAFHHSPASPKPYGRDHDGTRTHSLRLHPYSVPPHPPGRGEEIPSEGDALSIRPRDPRVNTPPGLIWRPADQPHELSCSQPLYH